MDSLERDDLIWRMREQGYSMRQIAVVAQVGLATVFRALARVEKRHAQQLVELDADLEAGREFAENPQLSASVLALEAELVSKGVDIDAEPAARYLRELRVNPDNALAEYRLRHLPASRLNGAVRKRHVDRWA